MGDADYRARLIAARAALGIGQDEMAARLLTPRNTYRQWEAGRRRTPGVAVVAAEAAAKSAAQKSIGTKRSPPKPGTISARILALADGERDSAAIAQAVYASDDTAARARVWTIVRQLQKRGIHCHILGSREQPRSQNGEPPALGTLSRRVWDIARGDLTVHEIAEQIFGDASRPNYNRVYSIIRDMRTRGHTLRVRPDEAGRQSAEGRERIAVAARERALKRWPAGSDEAKARAAHMRAARQRKREDA